MARSIIGNLVITTTPAFTAQFLIDKRSIWEHLVTFKEIQKDVIWYKVALHRVPIAPFNNPDGMDLLTDKIKIFNKGLSPISKLYWLTLADKR